MVSGTCQLTGEFGPLVKAHILPQALTAPDVPGLCFAQAGAGTPPIKRWTSWYDQSIVTRAGEDILSAYDDWAIVHLRRHRLVWSGWDGNDRLVSDDHAVTPHDADYGIRKIYGLDSNRLRLFALSLLWRAAASRLPELQEIDVRASDLRRVRRMLIEGDPSPYELFPVTLLQLSTRGGIHNFTPISERVPSDPAQPHNASTPIFRFYLDGLVMHFRRNASRDDVQRMGNVFLGPFDEVAVPTVTFERSWQRENLELTLREVHERWPDRLARIPGFGR